MGEPVLVTCSECKRLQYPNDNNNETEINKLEPEEMQYIKEVPQFHFKAYNYHTEGHQTQAEHHQVSSTCENANNNNRKDTFFVMNENALESRPTEHCAFPVAFSKMEHAKSQRNTKMCYTQQNLRVDRKRNVKKYILSNMNKIIVFLLLILMVSLIMSIIFRKNTGPVIIFLVGILGSFCISSVLVCVGYYYWLIPDE